MATKLFDKVYPTWRNLSDLEYGYWMVRFGEALVKHEDHQGDNTIPSPLANGAKIIEGGKQMITLSMAAEGGDRFRVAEVAAFRPQADLQVSGTVNWVVTRSVVENKPSIRENLHLEEKKEKRQLKSSGPAGVKMPVKVKVHRSDDHSGTVYISLSKDPYASMYYVQYCQTNPADEASWADGAQSDGCRGIEIKGLNPGEVYHFRVRCFGGGQYSPWSQIVTIRIL
jgi:hypothetical protein